MNAIVPLNIAALRVNNNDATNVVGGLQGKTASFNSMPWYNPNGGTPPAAASTGDKIYAPLGSTAGGNPLNSPANPLGVGVHLQWELPDYFRKGTQPAEGGNLVFPAAPNRWLVTRFLSFYDTQTQAYGSISSKSWVVESDYLSSTLQADASGIIRPVISVPIPAQPGFQQQPFMYMGRVVDAASWNPANTPASNYLPNYKATDGNSLYLTSIGFVGAYFGSYYPECCSVFGFWDNFSDVPYPGYKSLYEALKANATIQFRTSYQVTGWLNESLSDPLANIDAHITDDYNQYLTDCNNNHVAPELTPNDFFKQITAGKMKWTFNLADVGYELNENHTIASLNYPEETLSAGTSQEVVWNMLSNPGTTYFLQSNNAGNVSVWDTQVEIAVGNSTEEAVAAMLKTDMGQQTDDPNVLSNYEYLLDALQLGLLADLEKTPNKLITLEEALHSNAFSTDPGGYLWIIGSQEVNGDTPVNPDIEVTLPLDLAEQLYLLNQAQKNYDMGRAALSTMRKQLFMDWTHYVKLYTGEITDPNISINNMANFINTASGGELNAVIAKGTAVGILSYITNEESGAVTGVSQPVSGVSVSSLAYKVWDNYQVVQNALAAYPAWQVQCTKSDAFYLPNEPLVLMQGDMMEPARRNGRNPLTFVRLSQEILGQLNICYNSTEFQITASSTAIVPAINSNIPMGADVSALLGEACLITPMLTTAVTSALATKGGANNPAVASAAAFTISLMYAQGGLSPLDIAPNAGGVPTPPASPESSLFTTVASDNYQAAANPAIAVSAPQSLNITFSNAASNGWAPNTIGWSTQATPAGFPSSQVNPFLPVFMVWNVRLNPLLWEAKDSNGNAIYSPSNLTDFFTLDTDAVDYVYKMNGSQAVNFTSPDAITYGNSSTMSSNSTGVLVYQINSYIASHPGDPDNPTLQSIADLYADKNFLAQSISGFNIQQILTADVAQVAVQDLTKGSRDSVTTAVANAAKQNAWDNWYDFGFNSQQPISTGLLAQGNFGPLRSGFLEIMSIEIVDAFGQRMDLATAASNPDGSLEVITAYSMTPPAEDTANQGKIYLPPRLLASSRLWFQWLSASYDTSIAGITGDFEEMSRHPATSPVCGWIMPNHLDNNLFFYNADGSPIGTFGIEHLSTNPTLVYRTRAGNLANATSSLAYDIGEPGSPKVNANLANYMWYINGQNASYLQDLMKVILDSADYINPANYARDANLSVLLGNPLALVRASVGLETAGNLLPISQASSGPGAPLPQDVNSNRVNYTDRMAYSSANLPNLNFPLRLGDLANLDDGLVGYLMDGTGDNPYTNSIFYAPAADPGMQGGIRAPAETTVQLTLNAASRHLTMLVDPRAAVHATTGVLPVNELSIPPDQYSSAMNSLQVNFVTRPMLKMSQGLVVPLPAEAGYVWSWITPGNADETALPANAANETPVYGYSPQTLQEGWLELTPDSNK
ncbi:hypothetical protein [Undibacterium sp. Tian12W]|uniref:hypothetical protein n=1 Tax=Undibacterium sp. Tian12W TaxID=3413054 RepID=UPI003BF186A0